MEKLVWVEITCLKLKYEVGFMITWAKLSDIWGRKQTLMTSILIFTAFSAGCGGSKTLVQL